MLIGRTAIGEISNGQSLLELEDREPSLILRDIIEHEKILARENFRYFYELVYRRERTNKPVKMPGFQRLAADFIRDHRKCVLKWPVNLGKTSFVSMWALWELGLDVLGRGCFVSATQEQASKPLGVVRDYVDYSSGVRMIFPHLQPSSRQGDSWSMTELTVERPMGIKDASLAAVGIDGAIAGTRLKWLFIDDILNRENTATKAQRDKTYDWLQSEVFPRLDREEDTRIIVSNTPWHEDDVLHRLEALGWPSLTLDSYGDVNIKDDVGKVKEAATKKQVFVPWDSVELRPRSDAPDDFTCRLAENDPDPKNEKTIWPAMVTQEYLADEREKIPPYRFNQIHRAIVRSDDDRRCKLAWIEECKKRARERGFHTLTSEWHQGTVYVGVDLAVDVGEEHDDTAFFAFAVLDGGYRLLLDVDSFQADGPTIMKRLKEYARRYDCIARVENNGSQDYLRQFLLDEDISFPIKPHCTGRAKSHPEHGVESMFVEFYNAAWLLPNDKAGRCPPKVQEFIDHCLAYEPAKHTADSIMSAYFAREQAKEWGVLSGEDTHDVGNEGNGFAAIMAR